VRGRLIPFSEMASVTKIIPSESRALVTCQFEFSQKHSRARLRKRFSPFCDSFGSAARLRAAFAGVAGALPRILSNARLKRTFSACYPPI
jgi:hypothetical protein